MPPHIHREKERLRHNRLVLHLSSRRYRIGSLLFWCLFCLWFHAWRTFYVSHVKFLSRFLVTTNFRFRLARSLQASTHERKWSISEQVAVGSIRRWRSYSQASYSRRSYSWVWGLSSCPGSSQYARAWYPNRRCSLSSSWCQAYLQRKGQCFVSRKTKFKKK